MPHGATDHSSDGFIFFFLFDSVRHVLLLRKLMRYGFSTSAVRWIASYLSGRSQATLGGAGSVSSYRPLNREVPQGTVLGPLLLLLFINDICDNLMPDIRHLIYTDDLQVYMHFSRDELEDTTARMSNVASGIMDWAVRN